MELIHIFFIIAFVVVGTEMIAHALKNMEKGRNRNILIVAGIAVLAVVSLFIYADTFVWS